MTSTVATTARVIRASLPFCNNHPSPFVGDWLHYCIPPMDWGWNLLPNVDQLWNAEDFAGSPWDALHLGAFLQVVMNAGGSVANDHRIPPHLIALPFEAGAIVHGVVWKVDTNGQTFVVLKRKSAQNLAPLIGCNDYGDPLLISLS